MSVAYSLRKQSKAPIAQAGVRGADPLDKVELPTHALTDSTPQDL
jgi:hypothetical protein